MIKLVVTDIDDTLVCRERRVITKRGQAAMHALMDAGIVVGPATGRDIYRVGYSFRFDHALYSTAVVANGMKVYYQGEKVLERELPEEGLAKVAKLCTTDERAGLLLFDDTGRIWIAGTTLDDQKRGASPFLQAWGQAAHRRQAIAICKWYNARMKYKSNNNVVYSCKYHVVFCPKYRRPVLVDGVDERLKEIALEVADEMGFDIIEMEVMPDHVHMLLEVDPQLGIHRAVKRIKGRTSHDLRAEFPWLKSRIPTLWTNSYFVSTVGGAPLAIVKQYIENQKNV